MPKLTEKQIKARKYYAENAEKIKAQKRAAYSCRAIKFKRIKDQGRESNKKIKPSALVEAPQKRTLSARERIENYKIEKELFK